LKNVWEIYPKLTGLVRQDHIEFGMVGTGHDFDHALQVAQCALFIAEDEDVGRLAGAAGLCHNADRLLQKKLGVGKNGVPDESVIAMVRGWLWASGELHSSYEVARDISAVLWHSGPNLPNGDDVLVALQDADRISCSMADVVMGATQFWAELPTIDPKRLVYDVTADPYRNPKSVLKNLECWYDWIDPASNFCVRLPRAKTIMIQHVAFLKAYIEEIKTQRTEIGLWPNYPFES